MVDLKADFYVEKMAIAGDKLTMETIGFPKCESFHVGLSSCGILVRMVWSGCSEISLRQIGKLILEEEDSHYGILGIRLMGRSDIGLLSFVIDGDWFEVSIQCRAFSVESESLPYP